MSAARWGRLAATLADAGHAVTVDESPYSEMVFGRVRHGVSRSIMMRLDDGHTVTIRDTWWPKNPDVWTGWSVDLADREGIVLRSFRRTKKRAEVADQVNDLTGSEPLVGATVRTRHGSVHTRYELGWYPGPWNWAGLVEQGAERVGAAVTMMLACPLNDCGHAQAMHRPADTPTGSSCTATRCQCGQRVPDLAGEEWS